MLTTYPLASGSVDVLGCEVLYCSGKRKRLACIFSVAWTVSSRRCIRGPVTVLVNGHESFLVLSNRGALSVLDASFIARASYLVAGEPVRKRGSRLRFVKDVLSWPRKSVVPRSGQGSRVVLGPSVPSCVPSVPSRQVSIWNIQVWMKMRGRLSEKSVAQTSWMCRSNFWIPRKWSESDRFSIIYMIRIRFFGPGELNQNGLGTEQYTLNRFGLDLLCQRKPTITDALVHTTRSWTVPKQMLVIFTGTIDTNLATWRINDVCSCQSVIGRH